MRNCSQQALSLRGVDAQVQNFSEALKKAAGFLVLADPADLPALGNILDLLEQIASGAEAGDNPLLGQAAGAAARLVGSIILEETSDANAALATVGKTITALQSALNGLDPELTGLPRELGLQAAPAAPAAAPSTQGASFSLPSHIDESIFMEFLARQRGVLDEMEELVLGLEKGADGESLGALKRLLHTLKGESTMLGLAEVERLCHTAEDALGEGNPARRVDALLEMKDWLGRRFDSLAGKGEAPDGFDALLWRLAESAAPEKPAPSGKSARSDSSDKPQPSPASAPAQIDPSLLSDFIAESREHLENAEVHLLTIETDPQNEEALNAIFRAFHSIKGVAGFLSLDVIQTLSHEAENLLDRARKKEVDLVGPVIDLVFDVMDALKRLIEAPCLSPEKAAADVARALSADLLSRLRAAAAGDLDAAKLADSLSAPPSGAKLGEILVERGAATEEAVDAALEAQQASGGGRRLGEILARQGEAPARDVAKALRVQSQAASQKALEVKEIVKVDSDRLDRLVEMVGELVITESMVSQYPELRATAPPQLARYLDQLDKITRELQEIGASLRMAPVRATFQKMARLARDLAKKAGKQVEFAATGEDTELDKSVVDRIGDPLVHMVRNAVDHGLESDPADRVKLGKPAVGRVELRAFNKGGSIYIEVEDDGRGLQREAIVAKARERGLIRDGEILADREVFNLIFLPGFSTAKTVTDVSGRGVGMDAVITSVRKNLGGDLRIESEVGKGTKFIISIPAS